MTQTTYTIQQFVDDMTASLSASTGVPAVLTPGDVLLADLEATGVQLDFLQGLAVNIVQLVRGQTSTGTDLDSFYAQFSFYRLGGVLPTGAATLSRSSAALTPITVPVGTIVQTSDGSIQYQVVADATQAAWSAAAGAYVLPAGATSVVTTIQGLLPVGSALLSFDGSSENVSANQLVLLGSSVPGISSVTNLAAIQNGQSFEQDAAFRTRFASYLASIGKGTLAAILAAANNVQQGLDIEPLENENAAGVAQPGCFALIVNDGSGNPPASLISSILASVQAVRAFTVEAQVAAVTDDTLTIAINVELTAGLTTGQVTATLTAVQAAVIAYVNGQATGQTVFASQVSEAANLVTNVISVQPGYPLINGVNQDTPVPAIDTARTSTVRVTVGTYGG